VGPAPNGKQNVVQTAHSLNVGGPVGAAEPIGLDLDLLGEDASGERSPAGLRDYAKPGVTGDEFVWKCLLDPIQKEIANFEIRIQAEQAESPDISVEVAAFRVLEEEEVSRLAALRVLAAAPPTKIERDELLEVLKACISKDGRFILDSDVAKARAVIARVEGAGTSEKPVGDNLETSGPGMQDLRGAVEEMWAQVAENPSFAQDDRLRAAAIDMRVKFAMVSGTPEDVSYWKMRQTAELDLTGELGRTTAKWIEKLESSDVEADLFDDLLHDLYAPDDASEINNGGLYRQIPALISALGLKDAHDRIEQTVQENGFPEFGLP
jgi:hypothetical protein